MHATTQCAGPDFPCINARYRPPSAPHSGYRGSWSSEAPSGNPQLHSSLLSSGVPEGQLIAKKGLNLGAEEASRRPFAFPPRANLSSYTRVPSPELLSATSGRSTRSVKDTEIRLQSRPSKLPKYGFNLRVQGEINSKRRIWGGFVVSQSRRQKSLLSDGGQTAPSPLIPALPSAWPRTSSDAAAVEPFLSSLGPLSRLRCPRRPRQSTALALRRRGFADGGDCFGTHEWPLLSLRQCFHPGRRRNRFRSPSGKHRLGIAGDEQG